jgi:IS4 transposase
MARPHSIGIRRQLNSLLSPRRLHEVARKTGAVQRQRKVKVFHLFWTLVLGFGTGKERSFAGLRRMYETLARQTLVPSAFWNRFTPELAAFLKAVAREGMEKVGGVKRGLPGTFKGFRDLVVADATVIRLHEFLVKRFPACRTNHTKAACKLHVIMSVLAAGPRSVKVTSERAHDGKTLPVGPWVRDRLLLIDLGFYGYGLFDRIRRNGGYFISRLKSNANPTIVKVHSSRRDDRSLRGQKLQDVLFRLRRKSFDATVEVAFLRRTYGGERTQVRKTFRLVGVRHPDSGEYHLYVTNVPPERLTAEEVATTYRARWYAELLFAEWKSGYGLDQIPSRKKEAVEIFIYASVITMLASRTLLRAVRRKLKSVAGRIPAMRWAKIFRAHVLQILQVLLAPPRHGRYWASALEPTLLHEALDPHLHRPGLLQQVQNGTTSYPARA